MNVIEIADITKDYGNKKGVFLYAVGLVFYAAILCCGDCNI